MLLISFYICLQTFYYPQANELKRVLDGNAPWHFDAMRCAAAATATAAAARVKNYKMILGVANVLNLKSHDLLMEVFVTISFRSFALS